MTSFKGAVSKHSLLAYYILAFVISWGSILCIIGPAAILGVEKVPDRLLPLVYVATLLGPSLSSLLLTALIDGKSGYREMLHRLLTWRVGGRWYVVALLTAPILIMALLLVLSLASSVFRPTIFTTDNRLSLVLTGIVMGIFVGFFEEIGWTGFAAPRMKQRCGVIPTGLIMGLLWGAWHLPLFSGAAIASEPFPPLLYLVVLLFSFLPPYRILMVWVYAKTGSLLMVILMHAPLAASQLILIPPTMSGVNVVIFDLALAAMLWVFVGIVAILDRKHLHGTNAA